MRNYVTVDVWDIKHGNIFNYNDFPINVFNIFKISLGNSVHYMFLRKLICVMASVINQMVKQCLGAQVLGTASYIFREVYFVK